jgi:hypothetical protein
MPSSRAFDATDFGFALLRTFQFPGGIHVYEYNGHPVVDGKPDFLRLNLYLSRDGNYVTIWNGLLDDVFTEAEFDHGRMASVKLPEGFDFATYDESLFRGYIDSREAAEHIFRALRIGEEFGERTPQVLHGGGDSTLHCDSIGEVEQPR